MAKAIASVHEADVVHGAIYDETFNDVSFLKQDAKISNFDFSGTIGSLLKGRRFFYESFPECYQTECTLQKSLDVYMLAKTIAKLIVDENELQKTARRVATEQNIYDGEGRYFKFFPQAINRLTEQNTDLQYPNQSEDNLGKILQDCFIADPIERQMADAVVKRLTEIFERAMKTDSEKLETFDAKEDPKGTLKWYYFPKSEPSETEQAKKQDNGQTDTKPSSNNSHNTPDNHDQNEGNPNLFKYIAAGAILLIAVVVPVGFCLLKKRSV